MARTVLGDSSTKPAHRLYLLRNVQVGTLISRTPLCYRRLLLVRDTGVANIHLDGWDMNVGLGSTSVTSWTTGQALACPCPFTSPECRRTCFRVCPSHQ